MLRTRLHVELLEDRWTPTTLTATLEPVPISEGGDMTLVDQGPLTVSIDDAPAAATPGAIAQVSDSGQSGVVVQP